jgi:hypothetical protein
MWVRVAKVGPKKLEGQLTNEPVFIPRLSWNDMIKFERKHIIDFDIDDDDVGHLVVDGDGNAVIDDQDKDGLPTVFCASCGETCNEPDCVRQHELVAPRFKGEPAEHEDH